MANHSPCESRTGTTKAPHFALPKGPEFNDTCHLRSLSPCHIQTQRIVITCHTLASETNSQPQVQCALNPLCCNKSYIPNNMVTRRAGMQLDITIAPKVDGLHVLAGVDLVTPTPTFWTFLPLEYTRQRSSTLYIQYRKLYFRDGFRKKSGRAASAASAANARQNYL